MTRDRELAMTGRGDAHTARIAHRRWTCLDNKAASWPRAEQPNPHARRVHQIKQDRGGAPRGTGAPVTIYARQLSSNRTRAVLCCFSMRGKPVWKDCVLLAWRVHSDVPLVATRLISAWRRARVHFVRHEQRSRPCLPHINRHVRKLSVLSG